MSNLSKKKIAITGSIGSGKSTLKNILINKGYAVFDSDECVAYLYKHDKKLKQTFSKLVGDVISNNEIDKRKLKDLLFDDPNKKEVVESLVHPKVLEAFYEFERKNPDDVLFAEIPLLFEINWQHYFDEVWFVYANVQVVKERLQKHRKLDDKTINTMLKWQLDPQKKCAMTPFVLYNNNEISDLEKQVDQHLQRLEKINNEQ